MSGNREPDLDGTDELDLLLPWHVNRTLHREQNEALRAALQADARLQTSLAAAVEDDAAVKENAAMLGVPRPAVLERVLARTGTERQEVPEARNPLAAFLSSLAPRRMSLAVVALALLAVVQAGAITWLAAGGGTGTGPSLASDEQKAPPIAMVRPAAGATAAQFAEVLVSLGLRVSDGPTAEGFFLVRPDDEHDADSSALIAGLHSRLDVFGTIIPMEQ